MTRRALFATLLTPFFRRFLPKPKAIKWDFYEGPVLSQQFVRYFDVEHTRFDVLYGFGAVRPEYAVRIVDDPEEMQVRFDPARLPA